MGSSWKSGLACSLWLALMATACTQPEQTSNPSTTTPSATTVASEASTSSSFTARAMTEASPPSFVECETIPWPDVTTVGDVPERRNPDEQLSERARAYGLAHPRSFGGLWIDRRNGGTTVLAFTSDVEDHRQALADLLPSSFAFEVVEVDNTEAELVSLIDSLPALGSGIVQAVGLDTRINRVALGVIDPTPAQLRLLAELVPAELACLEATETIVPAVGPLDVIYQDGDDPMLRCEGHPQFRLGALRDPMPIEELDHPAAEVFSEGLAQGWAPLELPQAEWGVVAVSDQWVVFAAGQADPAVASVLLVDRQWTFRAAVLNCHLKLATPSGLQPVGWRLDPSHPEPDPTTSVLQLLVSEDTCADDDDFEARLREPQVEMGRNQIVIAVVSEWWYGYHACFDPPELELELRLSEPLGERRLVDGLELPVGLFD